MYSCAFVPSSPADLPQSVGERSDAALGDATVVPDDAGWRDTIGEAASAYAEGDPDVEVVEDFPDAGEALVVQPSGSPKCPAVRMVTYARVGGRYAATGLWGASVARPGERSGPLEPLYDYTTAEVVADALAACLTSGRPVAFGASVDPAVRDRIFERFARADASRERRTGSTGLGMSIALAIVTAHRGALTVDSVRAGDDPARPQAHGTTFTIALPAS